MLVVLDLSWHVGKIPSRCWLEKSCPPDENAYYKALEKKLYGHFGQLVRETYEHEKVKDYPARYPMNEDSIGIEMVAMHLTDKMFEAPTPEQQRSLQWLVRELEEALHFLKVDVYRHGVISHKNVGEAAGAQWVLPGARK
jgi:hypothetical protein